MSRRIKCKCGLFFKQLNNCSWLCKCGEHLYVPEPNYETMRRDDDKDLHKTSKHLLRQWRAETKKV